MNGCRATVAPALHETWPKCVTDFGWVYLYSTYFPMWSMTFIKQIFNSYSCLLFYVPVNVSNRLLTAWKSWMFTHPCDSVYDWCLPQNREDFANIEDFSAESKVLCIAGATAVQFSSIFSLPLGCSSTATCMSWFEPRETLMDAV
jgi:hypothetical protein